MGAHVSTETHTPIPTEAKSSQFADAKVLTQAQQSAHFGIHPIQIQISRHSTEGLSRSFVILLHGAMPPRLLRRRQGSGTAEAQSTPWQSTRLRREIAASQSQSYHQPWRRLSDDELYDRLCPHDRLFKDASNVIDAARRARLQIGQVETAN